MKGNLVLTGLFEAERRALEVEGEELRSVGVLTSNVCGIVLAGSFFTLSVVYGTVDLVTIRIGTVWHPTETTSTFSYSSSSPSRNMAEQSTSDIVAFINDGASEQSMDCVSSAKHSFSCGPNEGRIKLKSG